MWLMELICPNNLRSIEIGENLLNKFEEIMKIYEKPPEFVSLSIADKKYYTWISNQLLIVINFKNSEPVDILNPLFKLFVEQKISDREWLSKRERINIILKYLDKNNISKSSIPQLMRIFTDDVLYSHIHVKFPDQIPRIVERVSKEFQFANDMIEPLLRDKMTIIDLLRNNYADKAPELIEVIDFINRRNMLS
jgi:hypothetical protein